MAPTTQKALVLKEKFGAWSVVDFAVPTPGPKDVLVKITATALNPVDWKIQERGYFIDVFPYVGGTDGAGVVEEVGAEVTNVAKGDRIVYQGWFENSKATFQQYGIVPAEIVAKIPENISDDQAASLPLGLATVFTGLYNHDPKSKSINFPAFWEEGGSLKGAGKPAVVIGGSSSVGQYAIQLAKLSGYSPVITTSSLKHEEFLKSIGATHVINRSLPNETILAEVTKLTGGKPVEYVYDSISLDTQALAYDILAPGGHLLLVLPNGIPADKIKEGDNKTVVTVFGNVHSPENRAVGIEFYSRLTSWLADGSIVPNRVQILPNGLAGIPDGLELQKQDKVSGVKLIARPQETV